MTRHWWSERIGPGFIHGYEVELLYEERTPYQHMLIFHTPLWGRVLVLDSIVQLTEGDEFIYHEMMVHCPFNGADRIPESVLIIGGADGGALREVLKYDQVARVVQVELDRAVIEACRKYIPGMCSGWDDPRVDLVIGDGAEWLKAAASRNERFDCILLDSTDPVGPAVVLFERPFHEHLYQVLSEEGVIVRQAGLPRTMPRVMPFVVRRFEDCFPGVEVYRAPVPAYGDEMAFVACTRNGKSISKPVSGWFRGRFYNPECHAGAFCLPTWWNDLISGFEDNGSVPVDMLY